jgi:ADP-heptose:LPS heptosyltransferase
MILTARVLKQYRKLYPDSRIELGCPDQLIELFAKCPFIDVVVPLSGYWHSARNKTPSYLNAGRYDTVIYLRRTPNKKDLKLLDSFRPAWIAAFKGDTISFQNKNDELRWHKYRFDREVKISVDFPLDHELSVQARMLTALGAQNVAEKDLITDWLVPDSTHSLLKSWLDSVHAGLPIVVCSPCGSTAIRNWEALKYHETFCQIAPCIVVLVGTRPDSWFASEMQLGTIKGITLINLIGQTSLVEIIEVVKSANVVITAENGIYHICELLNKPCVCIAGGGHWGRFIPYPFKTRSVVLTNHLPCFGCNWCCVRVNNDCIREVCTNDVVCAVQKLIRPDRSR